MCYPSLTVRSNSNLNSGEREQTSPYITISQRRESSEDEIAENLDVHKRGQNTLLRTTSGCQRRRSLSLQQKKYTPEILN